MAQGSLLAEEHMREARRMLAGSEHLGRFVEPGGGLRNVPAEQLALAAQGVLHALLAISATLDVLAGVLEGKGGGR